MTTREQLCSHCLLPVGKRPMTRRLSGEDRAFCCYGCCVAFQVKMGRNEEWDAAWLLIQLGIGGFLSMNVMMLSLLVYSGAFTGVDAGVLPWMHLALWLFATPAVLILGTPYLRDTWSSAREGRLNSSALIVLGVAAAYLYSAFATLEGSTHVYFDTACMVLMLFTAGRYLEAVGRARAARDPEPLLAAESENATIVEHGVESRRAVRDVEAGMLVRVKPGERIPVDGLVIEGESHTDEAVITGESRQIGKGAGSHVIAGSINLDGPLLVRCMSAASSSRWAQICRSVRESLSHRSPIQRIADTVVAISVPIVLALAVASSFFWMRSLSFEDSLLIGLAVFVVACPCAVGLAAPMATSLGIGRLARSGCLVRDPGVLETLATAKLIAFDKTGTLTSGKPRLADIVTDGTPADELLRRIAGLERHSEHSLAHAIAAAAEERGIVPAEVSDVKTVPGRGVVGMIGGEQIAAGSRSIWARQDQDIVPVLERQAEAYERAGHTIIFAGWGGKVRAVLALDDSPLADAAETIAMLRHRGVAIRLLTGDLPGAAQRVGIAAGISPSEIFAGLSPEDKRQSLNQLRREHGLVAMVGDGLNDGPVLASADVGIAVGSATDLARETASFVLPPGGLHLLPWTIDLCRAVRKTIYFNLFWAFGYNLIALTVAAAGYLQPILAAAVMAGSSVLVVINSLRLERLPGPLGDAAEESQKQMEREGDPAFTRIALNP